MAEKETKMLIKGDLHCSRCYKKIKKILCEFPQIRDQMYDEKQNKVLITVVCSSPEKIRQKIIYKGGETVQNVEILPKGPKPAPPPPKTKPVPPKPPVVPPLPPPPKEPKLVAGYPPVLVYPMVGVCCCPPWYGGRPCYCGRRGPAMCSDGCGRLAGECRGGNRGYYVCRCDYFSEENATGCTIM